MTASVSKQNQGPSFGSAPLAANARDKIKSIDELASLAASFQAQGRNVVLAHGVFDLVHLGHVRHLEAAAREGDLLFVTVTADEFVNKGPGRPVFPQQFRAEMLAALECVDWVGISRWGSAEEVISRLKPLTYVKGSDFLAVNAQSNSANHGFNLITRYRQADYVCIDEPEARLATGDRFNELGRLVSDDLSRHIDCRRFAVTHGEKGCVTYRAGDGLHVVPAFTQQVVDTVGAGDAFLAVTAPLAARGVDMETLGIVGNAVGAMKVGIVGHRQSIEKAPLMKYITALLK
ncbi:MAG: PfkB family carbohydrate kinase [Alphaproteobacteria bacterium]|jgi:rfaE bifunctional protein nucleotidyltransferase chain/domain|nr:PfkB family carbohydrate kinase [Alphaproteobacteria bacterium]